MTRKIQSQSTDACTVGILGGGQLGSLLIQSFKEDNCQTLVYVQSPDEPACRVADEIIVGEKSDISKLKSFFASCDRVVLESEFYTPVTLKNLEDSTKAIVFPNLVAYELLFSKEKQKAFFDQNDIPNVSYQMVRNEQELSDINFEGPYMVKISHGGYDGKGNFVIETKNELLTKAKTLSGNFEKQLLVEKLIHIKEEFAVMLLKNESGAIILPPCRTVQKDAVCHLVRFPFDCEDAVTKQIQKSMDKIAAGLPGAGIYAFEFFLTEDQQVLVNEAAPRVHNSYHFSIEAFDKSQFDLCRDAALAKKLDLPKPLVNYATMVNILGSEARDQYELKFEQKPEEFPFAVHMYGKKKMSKGRKMGHITFFGENDSFEYAKKVNEEYSL